MPDLAGAFEKVKRANLHMETLSTLIRGFIDANPNPVTYENHDDPIYHEEIEWRHYSARDVEALSLSAVEGIDWLSHDEAAVPIITAEYVDAILRVAEGFPAVQWGVVLGDTIHNLRSALDHSVYALTVKHSGEPPIPIPRNSWWRNFAFPIRRRESWPDSDPLLNSKVSIPHF